MSGRPSNPYQAPKEETVAPTEPLRPPIAPVRLALGLVLVTICWAGIWLKVREGQLIGYWISILAGPFKPREIPWVMVALAGLVALLIGAKGIWPHRWLIEVIVQPTSLVFGWLLSGAGLVLAWWKRRNNPPWAGESSQPNTMPNR